MGLEEKTNSDRIKEKNKINFPRPLSAKESKELFYYIISCMDEGYIEYTIVKNSRIEKRKGDKPKTIHEYNTKRGEIYNGRCRTYFKCINDELGGKIAGLEFERTKVAALSINESAKMQIWDNTWRIILDYFKER